MVPSTPKLQKMDPVWISPWRVIYFGLAPFLVTCVAKVCRHGGANSSAGFLMRCLRGSVKNIRVGREYTLLFYFNLIFLFSLFQLPVARFPFAMPLPRLPVARCQKWRAAPWHDVCTHNVPGHTQDTKPSTTMTRQQNANPEQNITQQTTT